MAWWNAKNRIAPIEAANQTNQNTQTARREDAIDSMLKYEQLRSQIILNYRQSQEQSNSVLELREMLEQVLDAQAPTDDKTGDMLSQALMMLLTPAAQQQATTTAPQTVTAQAVNVPTDEDIKTALGGIPKKFLDLVRKKKISKEQAIAYAKMNGLNNETAERAYAMVMNESV
jgi:hypothetical protein